jgi:tetraacyldisaccharide 4'-kinase
MTINSLRRQLYSQGLLSSHQANAPVISIGNITVGGNRKTPLAAWLAESLLACGYHPAILSRGYGRKKFHPLAQTLLVSSGQGPLHPPEETGDEPYLLANQTRARVVTASDRARAARLAESLGSDLLILDDGFQHLRLRRDLDILALSGENPFGNGQVLPAGPLRESLATGARADLVVASLDCPQNPWNLPQFAARLRLDGLKALGEIFSLTVPQAQQTRLAAFCGLAKPWEFQKSLREWGLEPVVFRAFPDHANYGPAEREELKKLLICSRSQWLITTSKDAVKLAALRLPVLVAETSLAPEEPERLMSFILSLLRARGF